MSEKIISFARIRLDIYTTTPLSLSLTLYRTNKNTTLRNVSSKDAFIITKQFVKLLSTLPPRKNSCFAYNIKFFCSSKQIHRACLSGVTNEDTTYFVLPGSIHGVYRVNRWIHVCNSTVSSTTKPCPAPYKAAFCTLCKKIASAFHQ